MSDTTLPNTQPTDVPAAQLTAPVIQPATPDVPPTQPAKDEPKQVVDYAGNSAIETSINIFASSTGVTLDRFNDAMANALQYGDENLIDYTSLTQGLTPDQAAQAKALAQANYRETQEYIQRETNAAFDLAGGKEQWNESVQVFNTKAPQHVKTAVKGLLDSGDILSAAQLVLDTVRGTGMVNTGTPPIQGGNGTAQQGLSLAEFNAKLSELERSAGNRSFEQGEYKAKLDALMNQRQLGRQQGR